jgi:hypothetical protein
MVYMVDMRMDDNEDLKKELPVAFGGPTSYQPIPRESLLKEVAPYLHASIGQLYFGPSGIADDGVPWIVLVTRDIKRPSLYRQAGRIGLLGWRWNTSPSCIFSLTAMGLKEPTPHVRWMAPSEDSVVCAFRKSGRFRVCMAHPTGTYSGWFDATFSVGEPKRPRVPSTRALQRQWTFPIPGIPYSRQGVRFDPLVRTDCGRDNEVPLWADSISDGWATLQGNGPWTSDLEEADRKTADWAKRFHHKRARAAGFILAIRQRTEAGEEPCFFDAQGAWGNGGGLDNAVDELLQQHPALTFWLKKVLGSGSDAGQAHEAAVSLLNTPADIFAFSAKFMGHLHKTDDLLIAAALQNSLEAALLDHRITELGTKRPWLKNLGNSELGLRTISLDASCPREDLDNLWQSGLEFVDLLDAGEWFGPTDLPAPLSVVNQALESVRVEGSVEEAYEQALQLLREAQEARQWSIPWGARVEIQFGPFIALRLFEQEGEFSCHFLDSNDRYFHVAIGLGHDTPRISGIQLIRHSGDETEWNGDAEVSLQLIAAAIVRDFLVVEDRESVFSTKAYRSRSLRKLRKAQTIIYLPRVRYGHLRSDRPPVDSLPIRAKAKHKVSSHIRRADNASATQRFLAQRYGLSLPQGFTFVRPHERGVSGLAERLKVYRSRSASRMIFEEISTAPVGSRPAWFDFEKACARYLQEQGKSVIHQAANRDGDGGVDLFAVDQDGQSWVVQCKCWSLHRPVGPDVIRELIGAIWKADRDGTSRSRGMIMTSSRLTAGAALEAAEANFIIVDGFGA